jgi:hypothetical protein
MRRLESTTADLAALPPPACAGTHAVAALPLPDLVSKPGVQGLCAALAEFASGPRPAGAAAPHIALVGPATARWRSTAEALRCLPAKAPAAAGLRVVTLPTVHLASLPELAWALSQHPRARFVVVATSLDGLEGKSDLLALLSGLDSFSWPPNACVLGGFTSEVPADIEEALFSHVVQT